MRALIPKNALQSLSPTDLQELVSGPMAIDDAIVQQWRQHCNYDGYSDDEPPVQLFWRWVQEATEEQRRGLLLFWTGSSVPPADFRKLDTPFTIEFAHSGLPYPQAGTCDRRLLLPAYRTWAEMNAGLRGAVEFGAAGFTSA